MSIFRFFIAILLINSSLSAVIYLNEPPNFHPKIEIVGCFLEYKDEILLLHRQNNKTHGNTWAIPGGKVEKGETPLQAVIREASEETQFDLTKQKITYLGKVFINDTKIDFIYHMFQCHPIEDPGSVKISFIEHKGFTWVTPKDALKMNLMPDEDPCIRLIYGDCLEKKLE